VTFIGRLRQVCDEWSRAGTLESFDAQPLQELIDVASILNALRALTSGRHRVLSLVANVQDFEPAFAIAILAGGDRDALL